MTNTEIVRMLVQDNNVGFYFLSDTEIAYLLTRNEENVDRAALEAAKIILLQLSLRSGTEQVDIFSLSGKGASMAYKESLLAFLKNPQLNPLYKGIVGYAGGISLSDMQANNDNADNNIICTPLMIDTSVETFEV